MTTTLLRAVLATGLLSATASHAQVAPVVRADIPFEFSIKGKMLPEGTWEIGGQPHFAGVTFLRLTHVETGESVIANPVSSLQPADWSKDEPRVEFVCLANGCQLQRLWPGHGRFGREFSIRGSEDTLGKARITRVPLYRPGAVRAVASIPGR